MQNAIGSAQANMNHNHASQLNLMPLDASGHATNATHVAVQSGDWFNPATWGGSVPGAGALVHIPADIAVNYDGASSANLFMVRVDGDLTFTATDGQPTKLVVDTIITSESSTFTIDADQPTDGKVDIVFAETRADASQAAHYMDTESGNGVLGRTSWDPDQLSLGIVASGVVKIEGQPVEAQIQLATGPAAGARSLTLDSHGAAEGWAVGQKIVIGASDFQGRDDSGAFQSHDEVRTITGVRQVGDQTLVTFDKPLEFDHRGPLDPGTGKELTTYVGNLTRNVTFSSAVADKNGDGMADHGTSIGDPLPTGGHYVTERGHVMFMHNDDVSITHSSFFGLGRTDKSVELDDYRLVVAPNGSHRVYLDQGEAGVYDPGVDLAIRTNAADIDNIRGRYALHIHEAGVGDPGELMAPCRATGDPVCACGGVDRDGDGHNDGAYLEGNVVWGSPGWGIVQHDSKADLFNNITFDIDGAAFVAETGNETGTWQGNVAFRTYGTRAHVGNDEADDFNADFASDGTAFWLEGRAIDVIDNIAISSAQTAFMYRVNGIAQIDVPTSELGELAAIADGAAQVASEDVPIRVFEGNRAIGAAVAIRIVTDPLDSVRKFNDAWSHLKDFQGWGIDDEGVSVTYSSKYIFEDFLLLGTGEGANPQESAGFYFKASVADITVLDSHVEGFHSALRSWNQVGDRQEYRRGYWDPRDPSSDTSTPDYKGMGYVHGIENPVWNLWNINLVNLTYENISGFHAMYSPLITVTLPDGSQRTFASMGVWNTENNVTRDDPDLDQPLTIELIDDSANGGLVALWREDLANDPNQARVLANHIPLAYAEDVYLSQIHFSNGRTVKRENFLDYEKNINNDIWSGTALEFVKTDSLGRHVFTYGDFAPTTPGGAVRTTTTNEKIIFTREQIDGVLKSEGFYTVEGGGSVKFVVIHTVFTDGITGELTIKGFLVALDLAWELPSGARDLGQFLGDPDVIVAPKYLVFRDGLPVAGQAAITPVFERQFDPTAGELRAVEPQGPKPGSDSVDHANTPIDRDFGLSRAADYANHNERPGRAFTPPPAEIDRDTVLRQTGTRDDDTLNGTAGRDWLTGGRGADNFVFRTWGGNDAVRDFEIGTDTITLRMPHGDFDDLVIVQHGADAVVIYGEGLRLTVDNTQAANLHADSFAFL